MNAHRNNPDSDEMNRADYENRRAVFAAQMAAQATQEAEGDEAEGAQCSTCGAVSWSHRLSKPTK